jgi:hypothetical protein
MMFGRRRETNLSGTMLTVLLGIAAVGLIMFSRELPSMRRYVRIRRM